MLACVQTVRGRRVTPLGVLLPGIICQRNSGMKSIRGYSWRLNDTHIGLELNTAVTAAFIRDTQKGNCARKKKRKDNPEKQVSTASKRLNCWGPEATATARHTFTYDNWERRYLLKMVLLRPYSGEFLQYPETRLIQALITHNIPGFGPSFSGTVAVILLITPDWSDTIQKLWAHSVLFKSFLMNHSGVSGALTRTAQPVSCPVLRFD